MFNNKKRSAVYNTVIQTNRYTYKTKLKYNNNVIIRIDRVGSQKETDE